VGMSLVHLCVVFYNIKLLTRLLHDFPHVANLKDGVSNHGLQGLHDDDCDTHVVMLLLLLLLLLLMMMRCNVQAFMAYPAPHIYF
jgi:hypothetical protein